ncbi:MAG: transporter substrate-binding domain-containing protein [Rhodospirillaceae bacterium]|jgi:polar amino acid transport system substrate-binding protein|nr:transporter substrate-binding domain-containing protein [Rhodospirillales bacterium]MBT3906752.1 transporter substrate-binding domain-containing protein [Rhodospirillaceae bacterium]MBT4702491.1 transporter substrate-binding domain-containing protein [Rhodospirillaceae bacterium]MBT6221264.1 transporter substrate-binding domain-containing protein [Rhodospirillaceae bacterium]MBT6362841.1 transporter substrate-binding domain-containing protein [Rhodospirillaceae bacterium]
MNKNGLIGIILGALLAFPASAAETLTISYIQPGSFTIDIVLEILKKAYGRAGIGLKFLPFPGKRLVMTADSGDTDGEAARSTRATKLYPNLRRLSTPIFTAEIVAFSKDVKGPIATFSDLKPYIVGYRRGATMQSKLSQGRQKVELEPIQQGFRMMELGRLDIIIHFRYSGIKVLKEEFPGTKIKLISGSLRSVPLYHYLHKSKKHLIPKLDGVLKEMQKSGELNRIAERFANIN